MFVTCEMYSLNYTPVKIIFKKQDNRSHDLFINDVPREKGP